VIALDTNVLVYAEGFGDVWKVRRAEALGIGLPPDRVVLPVQVLAELYRVLVRKVRLTPDEARTRVFRWQAAFSTAPYGANLLASAIDMSVAHGIRSSMPLFWPLRRQTGAMFCCPRTCRTGPRSLA
jgi:predicted nucleic acid-binding protein